MSDITAGMATVFTLLILGAMLAGGCVVGLIWWLL